MRPPTAVLVAMFLNRRGSYKSAALSPLLPAALEEIGSQRLKLRGKVRLVDELARDRVVSIESGRTKVTGSDSTRLT